MAPSRVWWTALVILVCYIAAASSQDREKGFCSSGEWQCPDGQCIEASLECNGFYNCNDKGDEDSEHCRRKYPREPQCPESCTCEGHSPELHFSEVTCSGRNLTAVPEGLDLIVSERAARWADTSVHQYVDLSNNNITRVPEGVFDGLPGLWTLLLQNNSVSSLSEGAFVGLNELHNLHLNNNSITRLPEKVFEDLTRLHELHLGHNKLSSLLQGVFSELEDLTYLNLSNNAITSLDNNTFTGLDDLMLLDLSNNAITSVDGHTFAGLRDLMTLDLQNNKLTVLPEELLLGLKSLIKLDLHGNNLASLPEGVFNGPWGLKRLYLHANNIDGLPGDVFKGLTSLQWLSLEHNHISSLPANIFNDLESVTTLRLENNAITDLPDSLFSQMESLKTLHLHNNQICNLPEDVFGWRSSETLTEIFLHNNDIRSISGNPFLEMKLLYKVTSDNPAICCLVHHVDEDVDCWPEVGLASCEGLLGDRALSVLFWIIGLNVLLWNVIVVVWMIRGKTYNLVVGNLAASDFLMGIYLIIIAAVDVYYGKDYVGHDMWWRASALCTAAGFLGTFAGELGVASLIVIATDRVKTLGKRQLMGILLAIWALVLFLCALPFVPSFGDFYGQSEVGLPLPIASKRQASVSVEFAMDDSYFSVDEYTDSTVTATTSTYTPDGWKYSVFVFVIINSVAFLAIFALYIWSLSTQDDKSIARKMALISLVDAMCWFPVVALGINSLLGNIIHQRAYSWVAVVVLGLKSVLNPFLYTLLSRWCCREEYDAVQQLEMSRTY